MATLVPPTATTPAASIEPEKVDYLNLPCPIPYEEIHREALISLKPELFEGMRFDFTKGLNPKFSLSHSVFMGPTEIPSQSSETIKIPTAHYEFGANFIDPKLMLFGRVLTDGRVNARVKCDLSENLTLKANAQLTNEPHMSHGMVNFDYKGKDYRTQFQLGNGALFGASYIQSVTPHLSLGGEVFWAGQHRKSGIGYAARYNTDKMVATGQVASTGMVALSYVQKVSEKVSLASDFMYNYMSRDVTASFGYDYILRQSQRGPLDQLCFLSSRSGMSSNSSSSASICGPFMVDSSDNNTEDDPSKPLWKCVVRVVRTDGGRGGGNVTFSCSFCNKQFKGSYSRVKAHLLRIPNQGISKCLKITDQQFQELKRLQEEAELKMKQSGPKDVPLPTRGNSQPSLVASSLGAFGSLRQEAFEPRKRKAMGNTALEKAFNLQARDELQGEIARMFFSGGLPFHLARNPHYIKAFSMACNSNLVGFVHPGYNLLRTILLEKERANIEMLLEPIKHTWKEKGISIVSDGWTDAQRRPLINFIAMSESGPVFLKAVNCEGEYKDKHFIADLIVKSIVEVGPSNVVQVITDNAPVCRAAGILVELQYPHIFWTPCVVHTLNLALKNICAAKNTEANEKAFEECNWITEIAGDASVIRNFIMNHSMRLSIFNKYVKLKMLAIADTRFASVIVMLKRFKLIKRGLQNMVISEQWSLYRDDDVRKAQFVKEKVLDDLWWDRINYILSFTEPIYEMLRIADTDKPCLHLVYDMWDSMIEKVKVAIYREEKKQEHEESTFYNVVYNILIDRWTKSNTPLHCLAHSLNPRYYSPEWLRGAPNRVAPHLDMEIARERKSCLQRFFPNTEERRLVNIEFGKFSSSVDEFNDRDSLLDRGVMDPKLWWVVHGDVAPNLQHLALKLLGQPCSSSCCERNWSTYSFINSVRRNKMTPQRAENLVFVHNNLRLLSRRSPNYHEGESKMWDVGGDAFDSLDGAGILEIADLSLDEPDLEAVLFVDGEEDDDEAH